MLLKTQGLYLGLFDRESRINQPGKFAELLQVAEQRAGGEKWRAIPHFDQLWADVAEARHLLAWVLVHDGVYQIQVELLPAGSIGEPDRSLWGHFVGQGGPWALLECPSGELVVDSLANLGDNRVPPVMVVPPGLYRVQLVADNDQQFKHELMDDPKHYPATDGPDWLIYLQRVSRTASEASDAGSAET